MWTQKNVRYKRHNSRFLFLYLKLNHFLNHVILGWLNLFKSLPFVPLINVREAFNQIKLDKPIDIRIDEFILYFERTWLSSIYPIELWNHYDTEGPRTNNHVEGDNAALNHFVNVDSPNIYDLILAMKDIETSVAVKYYKHKNSNEP
jgi:hypothetical protein